MAFAKRLTGLDCAHDRGRGETSPVRLASRRRRGRGPRSRPSSSSPWCSSSNSPTTRASRRSSAERHAYEVALVVRNVSANVSRAEAALARFVLDEDVEDQRQYLRQRLAARRLPDRPARASSMRDNPRAAAPRRRAPSSSTTSAAASSRSPPAPRSPSRAMPASAISTSAAKNGHRHGSSTTSSRRSSAPSAQSLRDRIEQSQFFSAQADQLHRLSELARHPRRARRDLPRRRRRPGAAPERRRAPPGRKRGRARRSARAGGPRAHAGAVGGEPGAEGRGGASARPPRPSFARSRRWRRSAS